MSRIIDSHVHCYPAEVIADPVGWGMSRGEAHWVNLVTRGPQGWADPDTLLRAMDTDGVERVVLQAWYWQNPLSVIEQNRWHAEWVQRYPDRFWAMAAVHPDQTDPIEALEQARNWGARGVGEVLPQVQSQQGWQHPGWADILRWTTAVGWPLCLHVTEPVGHDYPGRVVTGLDETVEQLERFPDQRWILAHWGGGLPFFFLNRRVAKAVSNVWYDSAASPLLYDAKVWRVVAGLVGSERILFGSDFPLRLYPRKYGPPGWANLLSELNAEVPDPEALENILWRNSELVFSGC
jgi:predicted TIM-barrel fold metal-dependent hydrolase